MSFTNRQLNEILENLEDLAVDFKAIGRTGAWRILVDAASILKLYQFYKRTLETRGKYPRKKAENTVLVGPRFAIIESTNSSGRRAVVSSNASPDHTTC